ncbi:MAG: hypothetical protein A2219_07130 [Elusimicrobia bacterium RIFOXYA2_FULL_50_26]|nr:MAG: hypothetical protein A2219_07130 [Elusimicrobia bacterium RIFOXYA2_FULL_50_26]
MFYKRFAGKISVTAAIALFSVGITLAATPAAAPDFKLNDTDGKPFSLSANRGKPVFLYFWASWCPPCRNAKPAVGRLHEKYKDKNVVFAGINVENDPATAREFAVRQGMKYFILPDTDGVAGKYGVRGIPAFFLVNQNGEIVKRYVGYQSRMENEWETEIKKLTSTKNTPSKPAKK